MGRNITRSFSLTSSGIVGPNAAAGPIRIHSIVATETAGTTNETIALYVPTPKTDPNNPPAAPSAGGTLILTVIVPKGTTAQPLIFGNDGILFKDGLYAALSGGTPSVLFQIS